MLYRLLADANRDALGGDPEHLTVGMSITIPCIDVNGNVLTPDEAAEAAASLEAVVHAEGPLTAAELDTLFGPVALFPDPVLTPVLVAATFPLDVVKAGRFVAGAADLSDKERAAKAADQPWDDSVRELAAGFPDLVTRMSDNIDWTEQAGEAVVAQTDEVLAAIQRLRAKAQENGYLVDNEAQTVEEVNDKIVIAPAEPGVVYVPDLRQPGGLHDAGRRRRRSITTATAAATSTTTTTTGTMRWSRAASSLAAPSSSTRSSTTTIGTAGTATTTSTGIGGDITIDRGDVDIDIDRGDINIGDGDRPSIGDGDRVSIGDSDRTRSTAATRATASAIARAIGRRGPCRQPDIDLEPGQPRCRAPEDRDAQGHRRRSRQLRTRGRPPPDAGVRSRALRNPGRARSAPAISRPKASRTPTARAPSRSSAFQQPSRSRPSAASNRGRASAGRAGGGRAGGAGGAIVECGARAPRRGTNYNQVVAPMQVIEPAEPPEVNPDHQRPGCGFLLDGHLRIGS